MTDDLHSVLCARLQQQGLEPDDLPLFLRDLKETLKLNRHPVFAELHERLKILGWHKVELDYQSLQLAQAWFESETKDSGKISG